MDTNKKKIASDFMIYTAATYVTQLTGIFTSFFIRHFLGPTQMGAWSLLDLMLGYGMYANLGVLSAMITEVPYYIGKAEDAKVKEIKNTSFSFSLLASVSVGVLFFLWALLAGSSISKQTQMGIIFISFILISTTFYNYFISLMWAEKKFSMLGKIIILNSALNLLFVIFFAKNFGLMGLLSASLFSVLLPALYLFFSSKENFSFRLNIKIIRELLKAGLPLLMVGAAYSLFIGLDRMLIAKYMDFTHLGYYSITLMVMTYANAIPKLLAIVVFPVLQEKYGRTGSYVESSHLVKKPMVVLAYTVPLLLGSSYFIAPYLVSSFLSKYEPGIPAMKIMIIGSFFICLSQPVQSFLTTIYKRLHNIPIIAAAGGVAFLLSFVAIRLGHGLNGVAVGMSMGFFVYYVVMQCYVFKHFCSIREVILHLIEAFLCFGYLVILVLVIDRWIHGPTPFLTCIVQSFSFLLMCTPLLLILNMKTKAIHLLISIIFPKRFEPKYVALDKIKVGDKNGR